jgi:hypothetical protein
MGTRDGGIFLAGFFVGIGFPFRALAVLGPSLRPPLLE